MRCKNLHLELSKLNSLYKDDPDNAKLKNKISKRSKFLASHKKDHTQLTVDDVYDIRGIFNEYVENELFENVCQVYT